MLNIYYIKWVSGALQKPKAEKTASLCKLQKISCQTPLAPPASAPEKKVELKGGSKNSFKLSYGVVG
jgi:hypothetical protein